MRKLYLTLALVMASGIVSAQKIEKLTAGTNIPIRITSEIYSNNKEQTPPSAIVDMDIKGSSGELLIAKGTPVAIDATIQKSRGVGKPGNIRLSFISTKTVDNQIVNLSGIHEKIGASKKGTALGVGLGVGLTVFWPCLFCLCIKGEAVTIPANTLIQGTYTTGDVSVSIK